MHDVCEDDAVQMVKGTEVSELAKYMRGLNGLIALNNAIGLAS